MKKLVITLSLSLVSMSFANDRITSLPGLKAIKQPEYSGYLKSGHNNHLFYWFVTTKKKNAPLILWSNGGPGYSSFYGFFYETGPYLITKDLKLKRNSHGWNKFANYLVIDQPANVGMSQVKTNKILSSANANTKAYFVALKNFFIKHPNYSNHPLFLAGESYAGTYLPLLAKEILKNNALSKTKINLAGLILISPWADPASQQALDTSYAVGHGIISQKQKKKIDTTTKHCLSVLNRKKYGIANVICGRITTQVQKASGLYLANINKETGHDNNRLNSYLNKPAVRQSIHANNDFIYNAWSQKVNDVYFKSVQKSVLTTYSMLLKAHIPMLIISGLSDAKDTNFLGVNAFIEKLKWSEHKKHQSQPTKKVRDNQGKVVGYFISSPLLSRFTVRNAGHMVPEDQPKIDATIRRFLKKISRHHSP